MARTTRDGRRRFLRRASDDAAARERQSARDLNDIVGDHLIPDEQRTATTHWRPSRRGNSPHHR